MARSFLVTASPQVLRWARTSAGLEIEQAAAVTQAQSTQILAWESGSAKPTYAELEKLARAYHRTAATLLLSDPASDTPMPVDFRSAAGVAPTLSPPTLVVIRRVGWLLDQLNEIDWPLNRTLAVGSIKSTADPEVVGASIRAAVGVDINVQLSWNEDYEALRSWRRAIEKQGIPVFQLSMATEEIRGFSIGEGSRSVIAVASGDFVRARIFTIFHEFTHLLLGTGAMCIPERGLRRTNIDAERFCNAVAGAALVPKADLQRHEFVRSIDPYVPPDDRDLDRLGKQFHVSRPVMLYRLHEAELISDDAFDDKWRDWDRRQKAEPTKTQGGGKGMSLAERRLLEYGPGLVGAVVDAEERARITTDKALELLSIRLSDLQQAALLTSAV